MYIFKNRFWEDPARAGRLDQLSLSNLAILRFCGRIPGSGPPAPGPAFPGPRLSPGSVPPRALLSPGSVPPPALPFPGSVPPLPVRHVRGKRSGSRRGHGGECGAGVAGPGTPGRR